jgi:hypothetical protein
MMKMLKDRLYLRSYPVLLAANLLVYLFYITVYELLSLRVQSYLK